MEEWTLWKRCCWVMRGGKKRERHRTHLGKKKEINGRAVVCVSGSKRVQRSEPEQQGQQQSETASAVDEREDNSNFTSAPAAQLTQHMWRSRDPVVQLIAGYVNLSQPPIEQ